MTGSGTGFLDFMGAAIVNQIKGTGNYRFHYDEVLGASASRNLVVASWKEI